MAVSIGIGSALIGAGTSAYGLFASSADKKKQAAAQAAQMAAQQQAIGAQKDIIDLQTQENDQRKQALILDTTRRRREMVRNSIVARSQALTVATAQGAGSPGSSALAGAYGGISGRTNVNELGVNQNAEIGLNIFDLNSQISEKNKALATDQGNANIFAGQANTYAQQVQQDNQIVSVGASIFSNSATIGKIGSSVGGWFTGPTA